MPNLSTYHAPMRSMSRAQEEVDRAKKALARVQSKAEEMTGGVIRTAEVAAAGFAMGLLNGRNTVLYGKPPEIMGVPIDLALGVALNVAAHAKLAGKSSEHVKSLGDGALTSYFVTLGIGTGKQVARESGAVLPAVPPAP